MDMHKKIKINMTPYEFCKTVVLLSIAVLLFFSVMWFGGNLIGSGGKSYNMHFGKYKPMIIISESMTPLIKVNSIVLIEEVPYEDINIGDIILFNTDRYGLICHRVVMKQNTYYTKGDHNDTVDYWTVTPNMYKGRVYAVHNEFSGLITFLFGDLNHISLARLLFGFFMIMLCIICFIYFLIWLFHLITIFFFLRKSSRYGGDFVIKQYFSYVKSPEIRRTLMEIFDSLGEKKTFKHKWRLRWKLVALNNSINSNEKARKKVNRLLYEFRKDLDKYGV